MIIYAIIYAPARPLQKLNPKGETHEQYGCHERQRADRG